MNDFGKVIKRKRKMKGWTQNQLAQQLHVSPKSVSRWENENGYPDIELLPCLAKCLELDYRELLEGNEYIIEKRKRKIKWIKIIIICIVICLGLGITVYFTKPTKSREDIRDLLIHGNWSWLMIGDHSYELDNEQQSHILNQLYIDEWERVNMPDAELINNLSIQEFMTTHIDNIQVDISLAHYHENNYITIQQNTEMKLEVYKVNHPLKSIEKMIYEDSQKRFGYSHNHHINNQSLCLKEMSEKESQNLFLEYALNKTDFQQYSYLFIQDQKNHRFYFILNSDQYDFQKIKASIDNEIIKIDLKGNSYIYQTPYMHVFKVDNNFKESTIFINNKPVEVQSIMHIEYAAEKVKTFE